MYQGRVGVLKAAARVQFQLHVIPYFVFFNQGKKLQKKKSLQTLHSKVCFLLRHFEKKNPEVIQALKTRKDILLAKSLKKADMFRPLGLHQGCLYPSTYLSSKYQFCLQPSLSYWGSGCGFLFLYLHVTEVHWKVWAVFQCG